MDNDGSNPLAPNVDRRRVAGLGGAEDEKCCEFGGKLSVFLESSAELIQDPEAMMEKAGPGSTLRSGRDDN